jgi:hypothetical protein
VVERVVSRATLLALLDLTTKTLEHLAVLASSIAKYCREERVVVDSESLNPHAELTLWLDNDPLSDVALSLSACRFDKLGYPEDGTVRVMADGSIRWEGWGSGKYAEHTLKWVKENARREAEERAGRELTGDPVEDCARLWEWLAEDCLEEAQKLREKLRAYEAE